jgi:hypothetical protein
VHSREADAGTFQYREIRYAVDGRWDIGIGLWLESVLQQNISASPMQRYNSMTTIGGDYTIPAGNGVYVLAEHMRSTSSNSIWNAGNNRQLSALMMTYPLGVLDNLAIQEYYDWTGNNFYQFIQWQRTYDNIIISGALFHYPDNGGALFFGNKSLSAASGYGIQVMLIFNH